MSYIIQTERIGLRNWLEGDLDGFASMNADPEVMRFFSTVRNREESLLGLKRYQEHFHTHAFTYFLAEKLETKEFLGFIGLLTQNYEIPLLDPPFVDIGWRLKKSVWGNGYATEGAKACLTYAFDTLNLSEIYSVTPLQNLASEAVMKKIGMQKMGEFEHPKIAVGHPLKTCVLYRIGK